MATYEEVINGNINSLKELKDLVRAFKDELATAKEGSKEWEDAVEGLSVAQGRLDQINRAAKGTLEGYNNSAKDSINTLKTRIKELNTERNAMDMNSQEYAEATASLKELNDRLRASGVAAGDMKANVGNYAESLAAGFNGVKDAIGQSSSAIIASVGGLGQSLGGLSPTLGAVTTGFKGLSAAAGPVALVIAAISAALAAFKQGIESSETNTNKFKEALAPLQTVLVLIERAIQEATSKVLDWMIALRQNETVMKVIHTVSQALVTAFLLIKQRVTDAIDVFKKWYDRVKEVADKIFNVFKPVTDTVEKVFNVVKQKLEPVINWIIDKFNWLAKTDVGKLLGLKAISEATEAWKEAGEVVDEFGNKVEETEKKIKDNIRDEIALQQSKRALLVDNAKLEGEIAQKDLEIAEERNKEVRDYDKILELINEKTELQMQQAKNNVALKQQELAIIRQRNAMSDSNSKDLDAEAQAAAALQQAMNSLTQARAQGEAAKKREVQQKYAQQLTKATNEYTAALKSYEAQYNSTLATIEKPIAPEGSEIDKESINAYHNQIMENYQTEWMAYSAMTENKIAAEMALMEARRELGKDTAVQEANIAKLRADNAKKYKEITDAQNKNDKDRTKSLRANYSAQLGAFSNLMDSMSGLFEENTIAYKATATAKAIIDTFLAANAVLAETPGGIVARAVAMAATIAAGIANVMAIWKTDTKNPSAPTTTSVAATSTPQVDNTPYTYARTVQTVAAEETLNQSGEEMRVYVLESDITNAQNKAKVRVAESSW